MKKAIAVFVVCAVLAAFADNPHITQLIELIDVAISSPADGDVLTFNASTGKWNNKQPATQDGPKVVVRFQQENNSGAITPTTLFTPTETALYQGHVVVVTPASNTCSGVGDFIGVNISSPDGSFLAGGSGFLGRGNVAAEQAVTFRGISGSPWILNTEGQFISTDNCPYSFYVVVEKL